MRKTNMKQKLTKLEKYWVLYDVGNSAFTLLVSTIIPIYFKNMAQNMGVSASDSTAYLSYAISISTIIVAILGPILGSVANLTALTAARDAKLTRETREKAVIYIFHDDRCSRMCSVVHSEDVADVFDYFCDRKSRIFRQPDFL